MPELKPNWKKIKQEYVCGKIGYRKLADKWGVSPSSLYRRIKKEKWAELRKQSDSKADADIVNKVAAKKAKDFEKIDSAADLLCDYIIAGIRSQKLTEDAYSISKTASALKEIKEIKGIKSDIDILEQEARIDKIRAEIKASDTAPTQTEILLRGDLEKYSD